MKKALCLIFILLLLLCGCSHNHAFTENEAGNIVNDSGVEYVHLANEGILYYLGDLEFIGSVQGGEKAGMFAVKDAVNDNILIKRDSFSEWFSIYRKSSLPTFDFSADNCIRLEFVSGIGSNSEDAMHTACGNGISDPADISAFLSEVRMQKDPREAGLYDLVKNPNGMLENCYIYGMIYGFFAEEPNLAIRMYVTSYNDLAYSVSIEGKEYVLPEEWLQKLENK